MSKAYDRVEWSFLEAVMLRMGFSSVWTKLIWECITTVEYHILIEGKELGPIIPERGLRQGDPLSPYLFILALEGLSAMIRAQEQRGAIHGVMVAKGAPTITHLFFADDCFLFCRANLLECQVLKDILNKFALASGQVINYSKSAISFSKNVGEDNRKIIKETLEVQSGDLSGNYLGLPSLIGRRKREILGFIKDKVVGRIHSWNSRFLSKAGKEIMLKNVAQAIPTYAMSVFLLPVETCKDIENNMNGYWWNGEGSVGKGIQWKSWHRMCIPKRAGGMGFRKLKEFNLAMLAKQAWRFIQHPHSLASRTYKSRYFPKSTFMEAKIGSNPSFIWRSIYETQEIVKRNIRWRVGDGKSINIWQDPWIPNQDYPYIQTTMPENLEKPLSTLFLLSRVPNGMKIY